MSPFEKYMRAKYGVDDPQVIYTCLEQLEEETSTLERVAAANGVEVAWVQKWAQRYLASQVLRDLDQSDPFWRALLRLAKQNPEDFEELWTEEERRQPEVEATPTARWALNVAGTPFVRGRVSRRAWQR